MSISISIGIGDGTDPRSIAIGDGTEARSKYGMSKSSVICFVSLLRHAESKYRIMLVKFKEPLFQLSPIGVNKLFIPNWL